MMIKKIAMMLGVICAAVLMTGASSCLDEDGESFFGDDSAISDESKPLEYVVSVHKIIRYPRADSMIEIEVPSYSGQSIAINKGYYLNSKEIEKIEVNELKTDPGFYSITLHLTSRGVKQWIGLSVEHRRQKVALIIDGICYREFTPNLMRDSDTSTIVIEGPFDPATADGLKKNSERNYKKLNK